MSQGRDNRIVELLFREDMSIPDLAQFCGVSSRTVERWIREEVAIPDDQKRLIAEHFAVSVEFLLGWDRIPTSTGGASS